MPAETPPDAVADPRHDRCFAICAHGDTIGDRADGGDTPFTVATGVALVGLAAGVVVDAALSRIEASPPSNVPDTASPAATQGQQREQQVRQRKPSQPWAVTHAVPAACCKAISTRSRTGRFTAVFVWSHCHSHTDPVSENPTADSSSSWPFMDPIMDLKVLLDVAMRR